MEKGGDSRPLFLTGEVSLPFLAGLLLPALGFLRHCLLSPPSCGFACESAHVTSVAAAWHAHPGRRSSLRGPPCRRGFGGRGRYGRVASDLTNPHKGWPE